MVNRPISYGERVPSHIVPRWLYGKSTYFIWRGGVDLGGTPNWTSVLHLHFWTHFRTRFIVFLLVNGVQKWPQKGVILYPKSTYFHMKRVVFGVFGVFRTHFGPPPNQFGWENRPIRVCNPLQKRSQKGVKSTVFRVVGCTQNSTF